MRFGPASSAATQAAGKLREFVVDVDVDKERSPGGDACAEKGGGWLDLAPSVFVDEGYYQKVSIEGGMRGKERSITAELLLAEVAYRDHSHDPSYA